MVPRCEYRGCVSTSYTAIEVGISARELRSQSAQVRFSIPNASSAEIVEKNIFFEINQVEEDSRNG